LKQLIIALSRKAAQVFRLFDLNGNLTLGELAKKLSRQRRILWGAER